MNYTRLAAAFLSFLFIPYLLFGQSNLNTDAQYVEQSPVLIQSATAKGINTPPNKKLRTMAEWEEIDALLITWATQFNILSQILNYAQEECKVIVVCADSNQVKNYLSGQGITPYNVSFIEGPFNSIWSRDYAQWSAYTDDVDSLVLIDWIYNRNRPQDDLIPDLIGDYMNVPVYSMTQAPFDLVHTGGNFMVDGMGTGFSSKLVLDENDGGTFNITDKTSDQIDTLMKQFMGIERFIKMENLPYDEIHHIDMHMKLLDEETILVGEYPDGVADGPQIEANIAYIANNFTSAFGTPYRFVRIQMPPENGQYPDNFGDYRTYTNAVFVNNTILIPTYEQQFDDPALDIWREAMPGYKIRGINSNSIIPFSGAIHCITKAVGTKDPLLIVHQPIRDIQPAGITFDIDAVVKHRSGILNATLYYTNDTNSFYTPASMSLSDPTNDIWSASIPSQNGGEEVYYYISATSVSGKNQNRPMPAPNAYWDFKVGATTALNDITNSDFEIGNVYPNPASRITVVPVNLKFSGMVSVDIYDVLGRKVHPVFDGHKTAGKQEFIFDAEPLASGNYYIKVSNSNNAAYTIMNVK
ncbi:MAG: T9SS type A sorting domain-containing protein [Chitinophagales bacterium]|nr:T9SS type A sorting domain-containing protein [Chitinophagales bacterium]